MRYYQNGSLDLGVVTTGTSGKIDSSLIKFVPDLYWINNSKLGEELTKQLLTIRDVKRDNNHYY